jgi:hypothetical protein
MIAAKKSRCHVRLLARSFRVRLLANRTAVVVDEEVGAAAVVVLAATRKVAAVRAAEGQVHRREQPRIQRRGVVVVSDDAIVKRTLSFYRQSVFS